MVRPSPVKHKIKFTSKFIHQSYNPTHFLVPSIDIVPEAPPLPVLLKDWNGKPWPQDKILFMCAHLCVVVREPSVAYKVRKIQMDTGRYDDQIHTYLGVVAKLIVMVIVF